LHVSLSEVESTISKAVMGVGLPVGLGDEAGLAARHMMGAGLGIGTLFENALQAVDQNRSVGFKIDNSCPVRFTPDINGLLLSSIISGPSAFDLASLITIEKGEPATVTLSRVDVPGIILFEALANTLDAPLGHCVSWNRTGKRSVKAICWDGSLYLIKGVPVELLMGGPSDITITPILEKPSNKGIKFEPRAQDAAIEIDAPSWQKIKTYADRLFVGSTETSRLFGAGSGGLIETD